MPHSSTGTIGTSTGGISASHGILIGETGSGMFSGGLILHQMKRADFLRQKLYTAPVIRIHLTAVENMSFFIQKPVPGL